VSLEFDEDSHDYFLWQSINFIPLFGNLRSGIVGVEAVIDDVCNVCVGEGRLFCLETRDFSVDFLPQRCVLVLPLHD